MATATILHVGKDICQRIPLMGTVGFAVSQSEDSVLAIRKAFAGGDSFSAITFHTDVFAPSEDSIWVARSLSAAPFVLFENPSLYYHNKNDFDIVIPARAQPYSWLSVLHDAIEASCEHRELSRQLREECAAIRSRFLATRAVSARVLGNPVDLLWRHEQGNASSKH